MAHDNPLRKEAQEPTQTEPETLINISRKKSYVIGSMAGDRIEFDKGGHISRQKDDGSYEEVDQTNFPMDLEGTVFDEENFKGLSHTGLFIHEGDEEAYCQSSFHPPSTPTRIKLGHDGGLTWSGKGICSRCGRKVFYYKLASCIAGLAILAGIYKAVFF